MQREQMNGGNRSRRRGSLPPRGAPARRALWAAVMCAGVLQCLPGCNEHREREAQPAPAPSSGERFDLTRLRAHEHQLRQGLPLGDVRGADVALGADPYQLLRLESGELAGLLRGRDQLVFFDAAGKESSRVSTPHAPSALAEGGGELRVASELSREIWSYDARGRGRDQPRRLRLKSAAALRGLVEAGGRWYATDELSGTIVRLDPSDQDIELVKVADCRGALRIRATQHWLGADCLLEHRIKLFRLPPSAPLASDAVPRVLEMKGPFWAFELWETNESLNVVASGVEDAPLDRTIGSFGNIDSFLYTFRVDEKQVTRTSALNVSEAGVVLPKALWLGPPSAAGARGVVFAGYATSGLFETTWTKKGLGPPRSIVPELPPGSNDLVRLGEGWFVANPLLDAWVEVRQAQEPHYREEAIAGVKRSASVRLGEALFFTTLMAPHNQSTGKLSRFTCETCHFEGYGDGRVHATGRGEITATTKPLLGLLGNRPYFTRGLDRDLAQMVNNEFRVAGANSGTSPFFSVRTAEWSWLGELGVAETELGAEELREALLDFLAHFNHRPNPILAERPASESLTPEELSGASLFADHCASCHAARLDASDPKSELPTSAWPRALMAQQPVVWASVGYRDTGVEPRVHPLGARPSSLRRLYKKAPYLTNGRAPDLASLLEQCGYVDGQFRHLGVPRGDGRFKPSERLALEQFLRLL